MYRRHPPMLIHEALRSHCGISAKQYFIAAVGEDGIPMSFLSPGQKLNDATIRQFFHLSKFQQVVARVDAGKFYGNLLWHNRKKLLNKDKTLTSHDRLGVDPILEVGVFEHGSFGGNGTFGGIRTSDRRRSFAFDDWDGSARPARKRHRTSHSVAMDNHVPMTIPCQSAIKIGDADGVLNFYVERFQNCQQTVCKLIAKAWVKTVEPKKQSTYPYTGGDDMAPGWWPKPSAPTKVRHKEPDHLYKQERIHLLAHILRLVVERNAKQNKLIQNLNLSVKKMEDTAYEALSSYFRNNEANAKKRLYLIEIFKMATQEERFKNGEVDGSIEVYFKADGEPFAKK